MRYLDLEGYFTESNSDLKEANVDDLVYVIIEPKLIKLLASLCSTRLSHC